MVSVTLLIVTYRRFQFSDLSYVLIFLFMILHAIGAHYTYSKVPLGSTIVGMSGFFEVLESWVAQMVSPELGTAYLGTQGDEWDAQKDTTMAIIGALNSLGFTWLISRSNR